VQGFEDSRGQGARQKKREIRKEERHEKRGNRIEEREGRGHRSEGEKVRKKLKFITFCPYNQKSSISPC
jgi:hypothetical protein